MNLSIEHQLIYKYSHEVSLDPHRIYLYPKLSSNINLKHYAIEIVPKPTQISKNVDGEGNIQFVAFFNKKTTQLSIKATIEVHTEAFNPFDFVYFPFESSKLPFEYHKNELEILAPYIGKNEVTTLIDQTARNIAAEGDWGTNKFLLNLCKYINQNFQYLIREEGAPQDPEYTLIHKSGSCRDYSVFFIACCRALGLASRFVSGYYHTKSGQVNYLHAWVEVYLPGGGWRGFDPTQNNAVSNLHIPLASSCFPEAITPVKGTFRGKCISSLHTSVEVENMDNISNDN
jgi:transglutaminase-like putative cysteine protease